LIDFFSRKLHTLPLIQRLFLAPHTENPSPARELSNEIYAHIVSDLTVFWSLIEKIGDLNAFCKSFAEDRDFSTSDTTTFQTNYAAIALKLVLNNLKKFEPLTPKETRILFLLLLENNMLDEAGEKTLFRSAIKQLQDDPKEPEKTAAATVTKMSLFNEKKCKHSHYHHQPQASLALKK
jgi:hypothetical protein